ALVVEQVGGPVHDVYGHALVDLLRQLHEPERDAQRTHLVGEVVRVDGYAGPADAGARVERREAERLGGGAADRVPQVDADLPAEHRHRVGERDVGVAVRVLKQLGHLGLAGALGLHHAGHEALVEGAGGLGAVGGDAADDLRGVLQAEGGVARVDALGRERQVEVLAHGETGRLQAGPDDLVGGAGVGRGLQDDERAGPQVGGDVLDGGVHRAEVGRAVLGERGGHADDDGGGVGDHLGPVGRREA